MHIAGAFATVGSDSTAQAVRPAVCRVRQSKAGGFRDRRERQHGASRAPRLYALFFLHFLFSKKCSFFLCSGIVATV